MIKINLAIADDQILFRQSLGMLISHVPEFSLLFDADHGRHFLDKLQESEIRPDIALIDIEMPEMDGIELLEHLRKDHPDIKVIVLSAYSNERLIARLIQMGASGYLMKNCYRDELVNCINAVYKNGFCIDEKTLKAIQNTSNKKVNIKDLNANPHNLTQREIEVLELICKEMSNVEIAEKLFLSTRTVDGHRANLLLKTGVKNTAGLVLYAIKQQIVII